jgi:hypothetical protein
VSPSNGPGKFNEKMAELGHFFHNFIISKVFEEKNRKNGPILKNVSVVFLNSNE